MNNENTTAIALSANDALTMSSREIAELTGKRHDNVLRDIRTYLQGGILITEETPYIDPQNGQTYYEFRLNKRDALLVVSGYDAPLRAKIIDRWMELEQQVRDPANMLMAHLNDNTFLRSTLLTYTEKVMVLQDQVAELSPKAEALDRIATADGSLCVTDGAKNLQVRPKDLFTYLRSNGWTYRRIGTDHDLAYQSKLTQGLLEHKVTTVYRSDGTEKITTQVRITPKGMTVLAKVFPPIAA